MKSKSSGVTIQPRFRILRGEDIALGPGKADLLEHLRQVGSIAEAAQRMGMSYMRAWSLLKTMERSFTEPLISVSRGGAKHGGAKLTPNGVKVLKLYREMETRSREATSEVEMKILKLLRD